MDKNKLVLEAFYVTCILLSDVATIKKVASKTSYFITDAYNVCNHMATAQLAMVLDKRFVPNFTK